jgi:hypothetical protein
VNAEREVETEPQATTPPLDSTLGDCYWITPDIGRPIAIGPFKLPLLLITDTDCRSIATKKHRNGKGGVAVAAFVMNDTIDEVELYQPSS